MKIIAILVRNYFLQFTKYNQYKYGNKKDRQKLLLQYFIITAAITGLGGYWIYSVGSALSGFQKDDQVFGYILAPLGGVVVLMAFISSVLKGTGILYLENNLDALFSMPVKTHSIVIARLSVIYIYNAAVSMILLFPPCLYYAMVKEVSVPAYLIGILNILLLPVVPISIGVLAGLLLYRAGKNIRAEKKRYGAIIGPGLLFLIIGLIIWAAVRSDIAGNILKLLQNWLFEIAESINTRIRPLNVFLYDLSICLVCLIFFYVIIKSYKKQCYALMQNIRKSAAFSIKNLKGHSNLYTLVIRERKRYFSIPVYIMNTMLGVVLVLIYLIAAVVYKSDLLLFFNKLGQYFGIEHSTGVFNISFITILITITNVCYASVSIEGKGHEIIKSYPIKGTDFFKAKLLFHLSLTVPVIIVANTVLAIVLKIKMAETLLGFLLPVSFSYFAGLLGCLINIYFPDFEWSNVTYIVKQSASAIISNLSGIGIVCGSFFILFKYFSSNMLNSVCVLAAVMILTDVAFSIFFFKNTEKLFKGL